MHTHHIEARDLQDAWFLAVDLCYQGGRDYVITEGSYAGSTRRELDYVTIHIHYPQSRPLIPHIPSHYGIPDPVPGGMPYVEEYLQYLMTDTKKQGETYTYGERLIGMFAAKGRDKYACQVGEVIEKFKRGFGNNQACMTVAVPQDITSEDPPCLRSIDCRIFPQDDVPQLHFFVYFRSNCLWGGFPANMAAIAMLQEYMAMEIDVEPGEIVYSSKGLHLYDMYWDLAKIRLGLVR